MSDEIQIGVPADFQKRIVHFTTDFLNRGWLVRDAVLEGIKATNGSYGEGVTFKMTEEAVEKVIAYFEQTVEDYRAAQERGQVAVADGVAAEVVSDEEYRELTRQAGQN